MTLASPTFAAGKDKKLDGKALYTAKSCHTCHGPEGKKPTVPDMYPIVSGQSAKYIENQIKDIKSGKRSNGMSAAMKPFTMALTDEEITAIATYLSNVK